MLLDDVSYRAKNGELRLVCKVGLSLANLSTVGDGM